MSPTPALPRAGFGGGESVNEQAQKLIAKAKRTALEDAFLRTVRALGLPEPTREMRFAIPRKWRFDFCWIDKMLAVEIEGGIHIQGRHNRGQGFEVDCEKLNAATLKGWRVLKFTRSMIESWEAAKTVEAMLGNGDAAYVPAPQCPAGKHRCESCPPPFYERCAICGERFALIAETVLAKVGIKIIGRSVTKQ